jgi:lambda family phage portal protein
VSLRERLDGLISDYFPAWGAERAVARAAMENAERLSNYRGAQHTRLDAPTPTAKGASPDWVTEREYDRRDLVDRARQLERSSVLAEGMLSRSQESVVGDGFKLQAKTSDDAWNEQAEALWKDWAENACDVRRMNTFGELLALVFRSYLRDGDVGTVLLATGDIRVVESDEIATPTGYMQSNLVDGVELDAAGKPTRFHVIQNPRTLAVDRRAIPAHVQIPAENVLFLARRRRAGQTRGVSAFAGVTWVLEQIDGNIEAVTVAARMAACFGLVIKRKSRASGLGTVTGPDGVARRKLRVEPGAFFEVEPEEDVKSVQANGATTNFPEFIRMLGRIATVAFGIPVELLFMDFEKTNYSNARAALLQAWNVWRVHQRMLRRYCSRVYTWKLLQWMESGELPVREDALQHGWIAPGWQWIDPVAEIQSAMASIDAGFETRANVIMRLGYDPDEQWKALAKEVKRLESDGIPISRSTLTRDPTPGSVGGPGLSEKPALGAKA